jgi:hypothetical protein
MRLQNFLRARGLSMVTAKSAAVMKAPQPQTVAPKAAKPGLKLPAKGAPKMAAPKANKPGKYGKMANGKATGLLKLAIKWAIAEKDPEAKKMLKAVVVSLKKQLWAGLSDKSKQELSQL